MSSSCPETSRSSVGEVVDIYVDPRKDLLSLSRGCLAIYSAPHYYRECSISNEQVYLAGHDETGKALFSQPFKTG